jgi:RHS repeat-associated protein
LALPNGAYVTNHFDSLERLDYTALVNYWGHVLDGYLYTHDLLGLRTNISRYLGITTNNVAVGYDNIGQIITWKATEQSGATRQNEQLAWVFDKAGNLQYRTNGALVQTFTVDAANRLTNITRNASLNVIGSTPAPVTTVTVNGLPADRYADLTFARTNLPLVNGANSFTNIAQNMYGSNVTSVTSAVLSNAVMLQFDLNGNLTSDGTRTFIYDSENRLVTNLVANAWKTEFVYDGLGRRRIERDYGWQTNSWSKTNELHFVYDGYLLLQVRDGGNNVLWTYTRGLDFSRTFSGAGGIGGLLARTDTNGSAYYHADGSGNITALIDSSQIIQARYEYSPFGRLIGKWGALADANEMQFSSMPVHRLSGIVGYWGRGYDPNLQRWIQMDPIGEMGGFNLAAFVGNSPVNVVDPLGLDGLWMSRDGQVHTGTPPSEQPLSDPFTLGGMYSFNTDWMGNQQMGDFFVNDIGKPVVKKSLELGLEVAVAVGGPGQAEGAYAAADKALKAARAARAAAKCRAAEMKAAEKLKNILTKNFKTGPKGDISGAITDMVGNPIPDPRGIPGKPLYDHVQDLGNMLRGLRNGVDALKNTTDPALAALRDQAQQVIQQIQQAIQGAGL